MEEKELEKLVKSVSMECFNRPFNHETSFNDRLRTTGGRYHLKSHNLDFNPKILKTFGLDTFVDIIKHELCHYHLHLTDKGYRHVDADFKQLLKEVGGLRYTPSIELKEGIVLRWAYSCQRCNQTIYRKRRFNVSKFVCSYCKGRLMLKGQEELELNKREEISTTK